MRTRREDGITSADTASEPIAPRWHTVLVLFPLALGSVASWYQHGLPNAHLPGLSPRLSSYITVLAQEWCGFLLIWLALKWRGSSIASLVSGRWQTLGSFFRDLGLAVGFLVLVVPLVGISAYLLGPRDANSDVANFAPKTVFELVLWLGLAATAGFCEELIFRGYLTQQFRVWSGSALLAVVLQRSALWSCPRVLREGYGCHHAARMASWASCLVAQEPAPRNAGPRSTRCHWGDSRVLLMTATPDLAFPIRSNQSMKPAAPLRYNFSVIATTPRPWLISFSLGVVPSRLRIGQTFAAPHAANGYPRYTSRNW
jgi:membrane protease YdiL (CAAX protease family)